MNIIFNTEPESHMFTQMQDMINTTIGEEEFLFMNHYDLANKINQWTADQWKLFLINPKVSNWLTSELDIYTKSQQRKAIKMATDKNANSVGAAQMLNSLDRVIATNTKDSTGPAFIVMHIPITDAQRDTPTDVIEYDLGDYIYEDEDS